jgi:hypothetical protein
VSAPVDCGIEGTVELNKQTGPLSQEAWYDVEDGCYILEDRPLPPPEGDGLTPMLAQDCRRSPGLSQDVTNQHNDGNTQRTSGEAGADTLRQPSDEDGEHECGENVSELEKDIWLSKNKRICRRLILPTPRILTIPALSRRTPSWTTNRTRAEPAASD